MNPRAWNIVGVLVGIVLISLPSFLLSLNAERIDQDSLLYLAVAVMIGMFGFVFIKWIPAFHWVKKVYVVGAILAVLSNGILFFLSVKSNAFDKELEKYAEVESVKALGEIKDTSFYQLNSEIQPQLKSTGMHPTQLRKAMKSYSYHHVFPIWEEGQDSIRYLFGCITHNGMMGVSIEKYHEILSGGNRIIQWTKDPGYLSALDSLRMKTEIPIAKNFRIYSVTDPYRVNDLMHEYLYVALFAFNALFLFVLLLFNLKINQEPLNID